MKKGLKVAAFGGAGVGVHAMVAWLAQACPDLVAQWPALLTTGATAAL